MTTKDEALRVASKESGFGFFGQWLLWQGDTNTLLAFARAIERELSGAQEVKAGECVSVQDEVLAALRGAEEWLSGWASAEPYLSKIRAAIARATGPQP